MTISAEIRRLHREGVPVSKIAAQLGIRYQHAYNVVREDRLRHQPDGTPRVRSRMSKPVVAPPKPRLMARYLLAHGFEPAGHWQIDSEGVLGVTLPLPKQQGVYALAIDGVVQYVGVATNGLARRFRFYIKPGVRQRTSVRLNQEIRDQLRAGNEIEILVATPDNLEWNGLPVHGCAGLELGLITTYALPWNIRSAGKVAAAS